MPTSTDTPLGTANAVRARRRERLVVLLLLLLSLAGLKAAFNPGLGRNSLDGDYYYQIARHVAEGDGLVTSVSLYHQGFKEMPHPATIYPLWPLLLGWMAALLGSLPRVAAVLPEVLYLVALALLYPLGNRLLVRLRGVPDPALWPGARVLTGGHAVVAFFGLNPLWFNFTSLPYTEALAFALAFAALLALDRTVDQVADGELPWWAAAAGVFAALAYLARYQMVALAGSVGLVLLVEGWRRRPFRVAAALAAGAGAMVVLPWVIHLLSFARPFNLRMLLHFHSYRETPEIAPFRTLVEIASPWEWLVDRAGGLVTAFNPGDPYSYIAAFGLATYLAPLALVVVALRPSDLGRWWRDAHSRVALPVASVLAGVLMVLPLHASHSTFLWPWRFHHRQALPLLFVLLPALFWLLAHGGPWLRRLALALLVASLVTGSLRIGHMLTVDWPSGLLGPEPELVAWLDSQDPPPTVVTTQVHTLAVYSRARFHWMECNEDVTKTRQLFELAGADYLLLYPQDQHCAFLPGKDFALVRYFGDPRQAILVLEPVGHRPSVDGK